MLFGAPPISNAAWWSQMAAAAEKLGLEDEIQKWRDELRVKGVDVDSTVPAQRIPVHPTERSTAKPLGSAVSDAARQSASAAGFEAWRAGEPVFQQEQPPPPTPSDVIEAEDYEA